MQTQLLLAAAEEAEHALPIPPVWIGVGVFVGLLVLLVIVLAFGKGRPHA